MIRADGSVVTWGDRDFGGDSSMVQHQLRNVRQIQATNFAFLAILSDGSVVTWGDAKSGGDSSKVQSLLSTLTLTEEEHMLKYKGISRSWRSFL